MIGWLVRCRIPLKDLGRLDFPKSRLRYRNGWIRVGLDKVNEQLVAILEDRDGHAMPMSSQAEARAEAVLMGQVLCLKLQEHTKYEFEKTGDREQVRVAVS